jgi:hypothetical protein
MDAPHSAFRLLSQIACKSDCGESMNARAEVNVPKAKHWKGIVAAAKGLPQVVALMTLVIDGILTYLLYSGGPADPKRIVYFALVLLFFVVALALIVVDAHFRERSAAHNDEAIIGTLGSVTKSIGEQYGVEAESLSTRIEILDMEGNSTHSRTMTGILVVSSDWAIPFFPGKFWVGAPGIISSQPVLLNERISKSNKKVRLEPLHTPTEQRADFRITIEGQLYRSDGDLSYEIHAKASRMFWMTKEEADTAFKDREFKWESYRWDVDMPIKSLQMEVVFPEAFAVEPSAGVFFGTTDIMTNHELKRVKFSYSGRIAKLSVDRPLVGLSYRIYWTPPPELHS